MPPVNDNFADAIDISLDSVINTSNVGATKETGEPNHAGATGGCSIWYKLSIPKSSSYFKNKAKVDISTLGSSIDTVLAVYIGESVGDLEEIASSDDSVGLTSFVSFTASEGLVYYIAIDGYSDVEQGDIVVSVSGYLFLDFQYYETENDNPKLVSNIPALSSTYYENITGKWIVKAGDGKFAVLYRYAPSGGYTRIMSVICSIDDYSFSEGDLEGEIENPYGGNFSFNFQSYYGKNFILNPVKTNENSFSVLRIDGLTSNRDWYKIQNPIFGRFSFEYSATAVFFSKSDKFIIGIEDNSYKYRLFSISISDNSITEHGYSDLFFPTGVYFSYPQYNFCSKCGEDKVVYFIKNSNNQMIFVHVNENLTISGHFQCEDSEGTPLGICGDSESERFVAIYSKDGMIKAVYSEISESSFVFGQSITICLYNSIITMPDYNYADALAGISWIEGTGLFTVCLAYIKDSINKLTILNCKVSAFEITPYYDSHKTYFVNLRVQPCCYYDKSINKVIIGMYGDGSAYMPINRGSYVLIIDAPVEDTETVLFWQNKILHEESDSGRLIKKSTFTIAPGTPGQPYVPSTPGIPSKTTFFSYTKKECKKVG